MLVDDLYSRLRAALPESVPVLRPEQATLPADWYETDADGEPLERGEHGLHVYLREQAPGGYVQIEGALPITSDGLTAVFWVTVASMHTNAADCNALALQVRRALTGTPLEPGPHQEIRSDQPIQIQANAWVCRPTYDALTLDGLPVT